MTHQLAIVVPLAIAFAGAVAPAPGHAQAFVSGAQLTRACGGQSPAERFSCDGYLAGTLDAVREDAQLKDKVCPPSGVKLGAMREAVGRFGQQHPDEAKGPGVALVVAMIKTNYPCPVK